MNNRYCFLVRKSTSDRNVSSIKIDLSRDGKAELRIKYLVSKCNIGVSYTRAVECPKLILVKQVVMHQGIKT